jgi:hypothetical protein
MGCTGLPQGVSGSHRETASGVLQEMQRINNMHRFLILSAFVIGAALTAPVALRADDNHSENKHSEKRYYDKQGHDYHAWNDNEDRAYRSYLTEQHQSYRTFDRVKPAQQRNYFKWRHEHPDSALLKVEIR